MECKKGVQKIIRGSDEGIVWWISCKPFSKDEWNVKMQRVRDGIGSMVDLSILVRRSMWRRWSNQERDFRFCSCRELYIHHCCDQIVHIQMQFSFKGYSGGNLIEVLLMVTYFCSQRHVISISIKIHWYQSILFEH